jgi:hypothetical protein
VSTSLDVVPPGTTSRFEGVLRIAVIVNMVAPYTKPLFEFLSLLV